MLTFWVKCGTGFPVQVQIEDTSNVFELIQAVKKVLHPKLASVSLDEISIFSTPTGTETIPRNKLVSEIYSIGLVNTYDCPIFVSAPLTSATQASSTRKQTLYKGMSVEASCIKYLDALAKEIGYLYDFDFEFTNPAMGDVLRVLNDGEWDFRKSRKGQPLTETPLPELFSEEEWEELKLMNRDTNNRIHDGQLPTTSKGKAFVILPHSKYTIKRVDMLQKIASKAELVSDMNELIVKDEENLSGTPDKNV